MKTVIKTLTLMIAAIVVSCNTSDKWYLGEWTDGTNTFTLTETKYSNPEWENECLVKFYKFENGQPAIAYIDPDTNQEVGPGDILGYDIELDEENHEIILTEAWHGAWTSRYHKVETEKAEKTKITNNTTGSKIKQDRVVKKRRVKRAVFGTYENDNGDRVIIWRDGEVVYLYVDNWASSSGKYVVPGNRFICCTHSSDLGMDELFSAGLLKDNKDAKAFVMNNGTMSDAENAWKTSGGITVSKGKKGTHLKISYRLLKPTPHGTEKSSAYLNKVSNKKEIPSFDEPDDAINEGSSARENSAREQSRVVFRRTDDVINYLSKHTFTNSEGLTLRFKPSGIVATMNGRSHTLTGAIRINVQNDVSAFITAHSPYDNSDFSFLVNCNQGRVLETTSGTNYYAD